MSKEITATINNITVTLTEAQFIVLYYEQTTELVSIEELANIDTEKFLKDYITEDLGADLDTAEDYRIDVEEYCGITPEIIEKYGQTHESLCQYCKAEGEKKMSA